MSEDIKDLLSRAFTDEPPLEVDRDEVFRQGRKRLRRKRFFEAGSVVAAVVVAVIGAATLTNLGSDAPENMPPAASPTQQPPPQLTENPSTPSEERPSPGSPPMRLRLDPKLLTEALYEAGVLAETDVQQPLGASGSPAFHQSGDQYVYEADVIRPKMSGSVNIQVDFAPGEVVDCAQVPPPYGDCVVMQRVKVPMLLARYESVSGQRGTYVSAVLDNDVRVVAMTTNLLSLGKRVEPAGRLPALSDDELVALVVELGAGVG